MNMDETDKLVNQLGVMEVSFQASDAVDYNASVNIVGKTIAQKTNTRRATVEKTSVVKQTTTGTLFKIVFANLFKIHSQNWMDSATLKGENMWLNTEHCMIRIIASRPHSSMIMWLW